MSDNISSTEWFEEGEIEFPLEDVLFLDAPLTIRDTYKKVNTAKENQDNLGLAEKFSGNRISPEEGRFVRTFLRAGFDVYREPLIRDCTHLPDFYISDPTTQTGVIVEVTQSSILNKRKKRQVKDISECCEQYDIPFVVLNKKAQEEVMENPHSLFFL